LTLTQVSYSSYHFSVVKVLFCSSPERAEFTTPPMACQGAKKFAPTFTSARDASPFLFH